MKPLKISDNNLFLEGLSLRTQFKIENINPDLSISFIIKVSNQPSYSCENAYNFNVFPNQGIVLPLNNKQISVKLNKQSADLEQFFDDTIFQLRIESNFNNQYNSILSGKYSIDQQDKLKNIRYTDNIYLHIGSNYHGLLQNLSSEAIIDLEISKSPNKQISMISNFQSQNFVKNERHLNQILQELSVNSKIQEKNSKVSQLIEKFDTIQNNLSMHSAKESNFSDQSHFSDVFTKPWSSKRQIRVINFNEVLILTVISALFFCLGSNIKGVLNI